MIKTYAAPFLEDVLVVSHLGFTAGSIGMTLNDPDYRVGQNKALHRALVEYLEKVRVASAELRLGSSIKRIERLQQTSDIWTSTSFAFEIKELIRQIEDDLSEVWFFHVPLSKVEFYDRPYFGEDVESRFQEATDDMREAATCFALGRWTAVVHHCMGIVQVGMIELGKDLGCQLDKYLHDWNDMLTALGNAIEAKRVAILGGSKAKALPDAKSRWAEREPFYHEVLSDVRDMKKAWRNPGFHFRLPPFDEAKAKKVLDKVCDFMKNLAENLAP